MIKLNPCGFSFPDSSGAERKFTVEIGEFSAHVPVTTDGITVTPYMNSHFPMDSSFALCIECAGKVIGYSSDMEWTDSLNETTGNSDLFISEAYYYEKKVKGHMDYLTLIKNYGKTGAKRLILTHMSSDMLPKLDKVDCEYAEDGKMIHI